LAINYNPSIVTNGLVLCLDAGNVKSYPGSGTTWTDLSGRGNTGTLTNGPTYSSANGGSLVFDGTNDYVLVGNNIFRYQDNFTIEAIARFTSLPTNTNGVCGSRHPIVSNNEWGYNLEIGSTGKVGWVIYDTVSTANTAVSTSSIIGSQYFHAVGMKLGTTMSLYLNGVLQESKILSVNGIYYVDRPFTIGGLYRCGGSDFYSTGNIAKVSVYNRALSATEISQNYNATKSRYGL